MDMIPVPEEVVEESLSSISSYDVQKESAPEAVEATIRAKGRSELKVLRNVIFGCLMGTALILAVATFVCFSLWGDSYVVSYNGWVMYDAQVMPL